MTLYSPPSPDMENHVKSWLFDSLDKIKDPSLLVYIDKSLLNLSNIGCDFLKSNILII